MWTILNHGYDGELEPSKFARPPQLDVKPTTQVPGACAPVTNLFHVSQALSWIAGTRNTIPERLEYVKAVPRLMDRLESLRSQGG